MIAFELSMPGVASWDGHWSGEDKRYVVVRSVGRGSQGFAKEHDLVAGSPYAYDFGDGWRASVRAEAVDGNEARRLRRITAGFCGYDWMVDEILEHGRILTLAERTTRVA